MHARTVRVLRCSPQARTRAAAAGLQLALRHADMRELVLHGPAALIYCPFRSLLHLPRGPTAVAPSAAALRPGGRFAWNAIAFDHRIAARLNIRRGARVRGRVGWHARCAAWSCVSVDPVTLRRAGHGAHGGLARVDGQEGYEASTAGDSDRGPTVGRCLLGSSFRRCLRGLLRPGRFGCLPRCLPPLQLPRVFLDWDNDIGPFPPNLLA